MGLVGDVSAAILAGGFGTRLRTAVPDRPKALAPVGGRPFIARLLDKLARAGVREAVLLTGHCADQVRAALGDRYANMRLTYSAEPAPLGTAGAVRLALPLLRGGTVLLLNGDSYSLINLGAFRRFHDRRPAGLSMMLARVPDASRFGKVRVRRDGRVVGFAEKEPGASAGWINAGVYLLPRAYIAALEPGRAVSLEREVIPAAVARGGVRGFRSSGRFIDIGTPESYADAEWFFAARRGGLRVSAAND
jgi:NDP-sugar pyrophosphorylase family protein